MRDLAYVTVFEAGWRSFQIWLFPAGGAALLAFGVLLWLQGPRGSTSPGVHRWGSAFWISGVAQLTVFGLALAIATQVRDASILRRHAYRSVEGRVENFHEGVKSEDFDVAGRHFSYSDGVVTGGFNHTASLGGPVAEGRRVRIDYDGARILRLQIAN